MDAFAASCKSGGTRPTRPESCLHVCACMRAPFHHHSHRHLHHRHHHSSMEKAERKKTEPLCRALSTTTKYLSIQQAHSPSPDLLCEHPRGGSIPHLGKPSRRACKGPSWRSTPRGGSERSTRRGGWSREVRNARHVSVVGLGKLPMLDIGGTSLFFPNARHQGRLL